MCFCRSPKVAAWPSYLAGLNLATPRAWPGTRTSFPRASSFTTSSAILMQVRPSGSAFNDDIACQLKSEMCRTRGNFVAISSWGIKLGDEAPGPAPKFVGFVSFPKFHLYSFVWGVHCRQADLVRELPSPGLPSVCPGSDPGAPEIGQRDPGRQSQPNIWATELESDLSVAIGCLLRVCPRTP